MKKIIVFLVSLFLTACVGIPKLDAPEKLKHDKKVYYQVLHQDLGNIIRYFYVQKTDSLQDWKSAVELLQDRSQPSLTLEQRIALRNKAFSKSHVVRFDVQKKNNQLLSYVIYRPTKQYKNWQIDIAKGIETPLCGFIQYKYSLRVAKNKKFMNVANKKIATYLKKYVVDKEINRFQKQPIFTWDCLKYSEK
ncbi:hypothetical protein ACFQ02_06535 [Seminibacterium arietis]|uniref:ATPases of ABC transporters with duplicated ATPase domains-containing protein n=1 Tax=Seminibacterium arietis TaxID=1173502 RepID=A0ABW3IAG8_9PAST